MTLLYMMCFDHIQPPSPPLVSLPSPLTPSSPQLVSPPLHVLWGAYCGCGLIDLGFGEPNFNNYCLQKHGSPRYNGPSFPHFPIYMQGVWWLRKTKHLERQREM